MRRCEIQTLEEKCEAIKSLLPCLTMHIYANHDADTVEQGQWVSEGELPPPAEPGPACDGACLECRQICKEEGWAAMYWALRAEYPILYQLDNLLKAMGGIPYGHLRQTAIRYLYLEPASLFEHEPWITYAEEGVGWLAKQFEAEYVPTYIPRDDRKAQERRRRAAMWELVRRLREEGLSQRAIAERTGYSQKQVSRILNASEIRSESTVSAGGLDKVSR